VVTMTPSPTEAWARALDVLEADLVETNRLLDGSSDDIAPMILRRATAWRIPQDLGPLPADLAARANDVLAAQRLTAARIARALSATRIRARVLDAGADRTRPVYLDAEG